MGTFATLRGLPICTALAESYGLVTMLTGAEISLPEHFVKSLQHEEVSLAIGHRSPLEFS